MKARAKWILAAVAVVAAPGAATGDSRSANKAVFVVEAGPASGSGFLADPAGLIVTSQGLFGSAQLITVRINDQTAVPARVLAQDGRIGVGILRVDPRYLQGVDPLPLAESKEEGGRPETGEEVVVLESALAKDREPYRARVKKSGLTVLCYDRALPSGGLGTPVLSSRGEVVAFNAIEKPRWKKRGIGCALWIDSAARMLSAVRDEAVAMMEVESEVSRFASPHHYPERLAAQASASISNPSAYLVRAEKIHLGFMTPPLIHAIAYGRGAPYIPGTGFYRPEQFEGSQEPVVIVQALPDLRWTAGSGWRAAGYGAYLVTFPIWLLLAAMMGEEPPIVEPPTAAYRFNRDFNRMVLQRDGREVAPLQAGLRCDPHRAMVAKTPGEKMMQRKLRGCYGVYKYPPEAFWPGAVLSVRILEGENDEEAEEVTLDPGLVARIWHDFEPWHEQLQSQNPDLP